MKEMNTPRGTARNIRRNKGIGRNMPAPSADAQAAQRASQRRANRKLAVKMYHKAGAGIA